MTTLAIWLLLGTQVRAFSQTFGPQIEASNAAENELTRFMRSSTGRTLFMIPSNDYRPITIDSAIAKGGASVTRGAWSSTYLRSMFPDRDYAFGGAGEDQPRWTNFDRIVFVSLINLGGETAALDQLERSFGLHPADIRCVAETDVGAPAIIGPGAPYHSTQWTLQPSTIHGCLVNAPRLVS